LDGAADCQMKTLVSLTPGVLAVGVCSISGKPAFPSPQYHRSSRRRAAKRLQPFDLDA